MLSVWFAIVRLNCWRFCCFASFCREIFSNLLIRVLASLKWAILRMNVSHFYLLYVCNWAFKLALDHIMFFSRIFCDDDVVITYQINLISTNFADVVVVVVSKTTLALKQCIKLTFCAKIINMKKAALYYFKCIEMTVLLFFFVGWKSCMLYA